MRTPRPGILLLAAALLVTACHDRKEKAEVPALLRVDSRVVTADHFEKAFESTLPPDQTLTPEERDGLRRSFLVQTIDHELVLAEGERLSINVAPQEVEEAVAEYRRDYPQGEFEELLTGRGISMQEWRADLEGQIKMEKIVAEAVYSEVEVSDEDVDDFFRENPGELDRPAQVRARQIVVGTEAEGERVLGLLRGGEPFENVARDYSLSPDAEQGGDLGFFPRGEMPPEFDEVVFTLPVGRISDLVKSEYGYHIFLVEEHREARVVPLEDVREEIRARLRAEREEEAYQQWLRGLRSRASIQVDWSAVGGSNGSESPKPE